MAEELFSGAQVLVYVAREVSFGTARKIGGGQMNVCRTMSETITPAEERTVRPDRSGSPDHLARFVGRKSATFEITKLIMPTGNVTAEPDDTFLWENAFGRLSLGATSFSYVMATAHNTSLTIRRGIRTGGGAGVAEYQDHLSGAIVNGLEIAWGNQGEAGLARVNFRGMAKDWGWTGNTTLSGGIATSTKATCTVSSARQLSPNSCFQIKQHTQGGSGFLISAVNYTNNQITFTSSTLNNTFSKNDVVKAYNPTATTSGAPLHARLGFLSLNNSTAQIKHLGGRITFEDNRTLLNEEVGSAAATRAYRNDRRNVTFSLEFLVKKDEMGRLFSQMHRNTAENIQVNIGDEANKTIKIKMKNAEWDMVAPQLAGQDMMRISMAGRALGTAGNDSLWVRFL